MNNLASELRDQGKYETAKKMHRQTLELSEKMLDPKHLTMLLNMNNLALVLRESGQE